MPTLEKLYRQDPESLPFRQPVDPVLLQIPVSSELTDTKDKKKRNNVPKVRPRASFIWCMSLDVVDREDIRCGDGYFK